MITSRNITIPPLSTGFEGEELVAPGMGRKVLAVDDDPRQLALVRLLLEHAGFAVVAARSASEALRMLESREYEPIHAVLSDVVMDHNDGFWLCQRLRQLEELPPRTPIVLISADFRESLDRELAHAMGATDLVPRTPDLQKAIEVLVLSLAAVERPPSATPKNAKDPAHDLPRSQDVAISYRSSSSPPASASDVFSIPNPHASNGASASSVPESALPSTKRAGLGALEAAPGAPSATKGAAPEPSPLSATTKTVSALHTERLTHHLVQMRKKSSAAEARYEMLFENATDALAVLSLDGVLLEVNRKSEEIVGLSREELVGRHIRTFLPANSPDLDSTFLAHVRGNGSHTMELPILTKDHGVILLEVTATTVSPEDEPVIFCVARDVTERSAAARRLDASERNTARSSKTSPMWCGRRSSTAR